MTSPLFDKVLIANRGEIACRIIRTLRRMGIGSVVVFHHLDAASPAVRQADEAVEITGETPVGAYLDGAQIIDAAMSAGASAIHPGYGFLSENSDFARAVADAGLTFIGPSADVIALMGDKVAARRFAAEHDVPLSPSVEEGDDFAALAAGIGFPLVIKAAAGGGGRGMRIVREAGELDAAIATAKSEAERAFGSGVVYAERWIDRPRHIEVQVFGDGQGGAIHLWERECSIQRRFQKVIEEAPSPTITAEQRQAICTVAVDLTKAAKYANAGTVEFVMAPDGAFYFLEMNTRLQVEHPVTEQVTGLDLVEWQLRIAAGEAIPLAQGDVPLNGHAIEARIYAEDPDNEFMPATGQLLHMALPQGWRGRVDTGFEQGQSVTASFDPMLAKLITWGDSRVEAVLAMEGALTETVILGVTTNTGWLARLMRHPAFQAAELDTGFLERHAETLARTPLTDHGASAVLAAAAATLEGRQGLASPGPWGRIGRWRN